MGLVLGTSFFGREYPIRVCTTVYTIIRLGPDITRFKVHVHCLGGLRT